MFREYHKMKMKFYFNVIITSSILNLCYSDTEVHGKYFGRGVCTVYLRDEKKVMVTEINFHNETTWEWCWSFPPWCSVFERELFDFGPSLIDIPQEHLKLKCCVGYRSNAKATACIPICSPLCKKGYCADVDTCLSCISDYLGPKCEKIRSMEAKSELVLPSEKSLSHHCPPCSDDNFICAPNGTCVCAPGFTGADCATILEPARFIVDAGKKPTCASYFVKVIGLLGLVIFSSVLMLVYIKRRFNIVTFQSVVDNLRPSTSQTYNNL